MANEVFPRGSEIHIVLASDDVKFIIADAFIRPPEGKPHQLNLRSQSKNPSLRCLCIALLLAKHKGAAGLHSGKMEFISDTKDSTWILTFGRFFKANKMAWFNTCFKYDAFLTATTGSTDKTPTAWYHADVLPLENLYILEASIKSPKKTRELDGEDLMKRAMALEEAGEWEGENLIVPRLLGLDIYNANAEIKTEGNESEDSQQDAKAGEKKPRLMVNPDSDFSERDPYSKEYTLAWRLLLHIVSTSNPQQQEIDAIRLLEANQGKFPNLCDYAYSEICNESVLMLTILYRKFEIFIYLMRNRNAPIIKGRIRISTYSCHVDVHHKSSRGLTAILRGARINDGGIIDALQCAGADMASRNNEGANMFYEAAFGASDDCIRHMEHFARFEFSPNIICLDGSTALSVAIARKAPAAVRQYLEHVFRVERCGMGKSWDQVLAEVRKEQDADLLAFLKQIPSVAKAIGDLEGKAKQIDYPFASILDRQRRPNGQDLADACSVGDLEKVRSFYKPDARIGAGYRDPFFGRTPLHEAVENGHLDVVEYLLENKESPFEEDNHGRMPRELLPPERSAKRKKYRENKRDNAETPVAAIQGNDVFIEIEQALNRAENRWCYRRSGLKLTPDEMERI